MSPDAGDLYDLYRDVLLEHGKSPRRFTEMSDADRRALGHNPLCGDRVLVQLKMDSDRIAGIAFVGKGCAICTASASVMGEAVEGKTADEALRLFERFHAMLTGQGNVKGLEPAELLAFEGVRRFPIRVKCATLPWHALRQALAEGRGVAESESID